MIRSLLTVALLVLAYVMSNLGMDYINFNYGLHPAIAFPISCLSLFAALAVHVSKGIWFND